MFVTDPGICFYMLTDEYVGGTLSSDTAFQLYQVLTHGLAWVFFILVGLFLLDFLVQIIMNRKWAKLRKELETRVKRNRIKRQLEKKGMLSGIARSNCQKCWRGNKGKSYLLRAREIWKNYFCFEGSKSTLFRSR